LCVSLANLPLTPLLLAVQARMWQQALVVAFMLLGLGLARLLLAGRRRGLMGPTPLTRVTIPSVVVAWLALQVGRSFSQVDQSGNRAFLHYAHDVMDALPEGGLLLLNDDTNCNVLLYAHVCLGVRPDLDLIRLPLITYNWWKPQQLHLYPDLAFPGACHHPYRKDCVPLATFLQANLPRRPVLVAGDWKTGDPTNEWARRVPVGLADLVLAPNANLDVPGLWSIAASLEPGPAQELQRLSNSSASSWERVLVEKYVNRVMAQVVFFTERLGERPPGTESLEFLVRAYRRLGAALAAEGGVGGAVDPKLWNNAGVVAGMLSAE
jgi:hypothetical protein